MRRQMLLLRSCLEFCLLTRTARRPDDCFILTTQSFTTCNQGQPPAQDERRLSPYVGPMKGASPAEAKSQPSLLATACEQLQPMPSYTSLRSTSSLLGRLEPAFDQTRNFLRKPKTSFGSFPSSTASTSARLSSLLTILSRGDGVSVMVMALPPTGEPTAATTVASSAFST